MFDRTFVDVTNFTKDPIRTGVQRVVISVISRSTDQTILPFQVIDPFQVAILDPAIFVLFRRFFARSEPTARQYDAMHAGSPFQLGRDEYLIKFIGQHPLAVVPAERFFRNAARIVNLESFTEVTRSRFYIQCPPAFRSKIFHLVHDFLVFEAPHVFPQLNWRYAADYLELFEAYNLAGGFYVSTPVLAEKLSAYFGRDPGQIKLVHFGADLINSGSAAAPQDERTRRILVLGTIEPRKYPLIVVQALDQLAKNHSGLECVIVGNWGWVSPEVRREIEEVLDFDRVSHLSNVPDDKLAQLIAGTSVAIYVSEQEGFGLPVIEFAALGIPVVTNRLVPSSILVKEGAQVLDDVTVPSLVASVERLLGAVASREPYYHWTWQDCADEIFGARPGGSRASATGIQPFSWDLVPALVRQMRAESHDCEAFKIAMMHRVRTDLFALTHLDNSQLIERRFEVEYRESFDQLCALVSENIDRIYWADLMSTRPLLLKIVDCILRRRPLECISQAFFEILGRAIDPEAATEVSRITTLTGRIDRILDIVSSDEAGRLGLQTLVALRSILAQATPLLHACFEERVDLIHISGLLGTRKPNIAEIQRADEMPIEPQPRLELLLDIARSRFVIGDNLDFFLDVVAEGLAQHRPQTARLTPSPPIDQLATVSDKIGVSRSTSITVSSEYFRQGWYHVETAGDHEFRWMGVTGVIANPEPSRPILEVIIEIRGVYASENPAITAVIGTMPVAVEIRKKPGYSGWLGVLRMRDDSVMARIVRLESGSTARPSVVEGTDDQRDLSIRVSGATFVFAN